MIYELLTKQQIEFGYLRFLAKHPHAQFRVNERTQQLADILSVDQSHLRHIETANALIEQASALGIDSFEYLLKFSIRNDSHRRKIMKLRDELMSRDIINYRKPPNRIAKKPV